MIIPVIAALGVSTKGPSGKPKSKYLSPSLTTTDKPIPKATPKPEPITAIYNDSETTSLYICRLEVPSALNKESSLVLEAEEF